MSLTNAKIARNTAMIVTGREKTRMYECFHCGARAVIWDADFDFDDFGYEGEGVVHVCHCANCGAEIEYRISIGGDDED